LSNKDVELANQIKDLSSTLSIIDSQMSDIKAQTEANTDLLLAMNPENMVYKDVLGNVDLLKGKLEAAEVVAGSFTVKMINEDAKTIGDAIIEKVNKDENNDGIDDETGSDGKSVVVKTKAVSENSKIFVTPKSTLSEPLAVTTINSGDSFTVEVKSKVDENVKFDWWIVESR
jgi:hypothetical protein